MINWEITHEEPDYYEELLAAGVDEDLASDAAYVLEQAGELLTEEIIAGALIIEPGDVEGALEAVKDLENFKIAQIPEITKLTNEDGDTVYHIAPLT